MSSGPLTIDVHTHVLPESWPDLADRYGYPGFVQLERTGPGCARMLKDGRPFRDVSANCWCPETRISECDRAGVDVQVLSTVPVMFSYWAEPEHTLDLSRLLNDHLAGLVAANPSRFLALGTIPLQDADLAIHELERCTRELGMPGVQIGTNVNGANLDDPALFPVFEAAQDLGAAVFVHPWEMLGGTRTERHWMAWLVGMPAETALAVCSVILGGVLERLPDLRIGFAHGGGAFPHTIGRIERGFVCRPDLVATGTSLGPRDQISRLYVDSLVHDEAALRYLVDLVGAERIALGTDYPFPLGEAKPGRLILDSDAFSAEQKARMLAGTALEFLDVDSERFAS